MDGTSAGRRHYLMCPPTHFGVDYAINPWMDPAATVDRALARAQWEQLRAVLRGLGHSVHQMVPRPGLPDMVFTANAATVVDGRVLVARFRHPERAPEADHFRSWFADGPFDRVRTARWVNEGQGDVLLAGRRLLAGTGFRTEPAALAELGEVLRLPVVPLRLVDPWFYHLDTALTVLTERQAVHYPGAFDRRSREVLADVFPDVLAATREEARAFGLNALSDGHHVVLPPGLDRLTAELTARGFEVVTVDVSEFRKAGGGVKCCVLELHGAERLEALAC